MSQPAGRTEFGVRHPAHAKLEYSGLYFRFEDDSKPRIEFTKSEVIIGCKRISRIAFEELYRRYEEFLKERNQVVQEGTY